MLDRDPRERFLPRTCYWPHALAVLAIVALAGCQRPNGLTQVTGRVTWRGKVVPVGMVSIEPDTVQGNRGPQARAAIADGTFKTRGEFGAVSGPVVVEVQGFESTGKTEALVPLFPTHTFKTEIPKGKATLDIVVPEDAGKPKPRR